MSQTEQNKAIVRRFNSDFMERGDMQAFEEIIAPSFINHTAPAGMPRDRDGLLHMYREVIRKALPDLRIEILDMIAEGDTVVTRKVITGTLMAPFMGVPATGKPVVIPTIDIVKLRNGQYTDHWAERHVEQ